MGAAGFVAGVVAELEELFDVGVPGLEVDAARALALAALVDRGDRGIERLQPGTMPLDLPLVLPISEPRDRTRWNPRPMPPENFESIATSV